jgi:rod shape-determining protein MreD
MIHSYIKHIIILITAVILQVLIFDNIRLGGYINPYFYLIFILVLPFETPRWLLLLSAFLLGFIIDVFNDSYGMHSAASVFLAFLRPFVLRIFSPREGYDNGTLPRISYYGTAWFVKYAAVLVFSHHFLLFMLEIFRFDGFAYAIIRIILSSFITTSIVVASQFFIFRK